MYRRTSRSRRRFSDSRPYAARLHSRLSRIRRTASTGDAFELIEYLGPTFDTLWEKLEDVPDEVRARAESFLEDEFKPPLREILDLTNEMIEDLDDDKDLSDWD